MAVILAQTTLAASTGVPADEIVTTFHYEDTNPSPSTNASAVRALMFSFWQDIDAFLSPLMASTSGAHETQLYNLDDPQPRQPFSFGAFTLAGTGTALPPEVACCLSYRGDYVSGTPNARKRGRFFVGPLNTTALTGAVFSTSFLNTLAVAGQDLAQGLNALTNIEFGVWSPTANAFTPATRVSADNACDVQRRRGRLATSKVDVAI